MREKTKLDGDLLSVSLPIDLDLAELAWRCVLLLLSISLRLLSPLFNTHFARRQQQQQEQTFSLAVRDRGGRKHSSYGQAVAVGRLRKSKNLLLEERAGSKLADFALATKNGDDDEEDDDLASGHSHRVVFLSDATTTTCCIGVARSCAQALLA